MCVRVNPRNTHMFGLTPIIYQCILIHMNRRVIGNPNPNNPIYVYQSALIYNVRTIPRMSFSWYTDLSDVAFYLLFVFRIRLLRRRGNNTRAYIYIYIHIYEHVCVSIHVYQSALIYNVRYITQMSFHGIQISLMWG